jgi:hypothetical protein
MLNISIPSQYEKYIKENQGIITVSTPNNIYINFETKENIG